MRQIADLKAKNHIAEQQEIVGKLKSTYQTFLNMSSLSGIPLKTIHGMCSVRKQKTHKSTELANLRKKEFKSFLLQDSVSFSHPSKKFAGKRFLRDTLEVTRKKYLAQNEYHKNRMISLSSMKIYRPSYIMLCGDTPLDQCLCDKCENYEQILKALLSIGMKSILANRYVAIEKVVCSDRYP